MKKLWLIGIIFYNVNLIGAQSMYALLQKCLPCLKKDREQCLQDYSADDRAIVKFENTMYDSPESTQNYFRPISDTPNSDNLDNQ